MKTITFLKSLFLLIILAVLKFSLFSSHVKAQVVNEFPPNLPAKFGDFPLNAGRVESIAANPRNNNEIFISTQFGGLWKSTNRGFSWTHLNSFNTVFTKDIAFSQDGETLIATRVRDSGLRHTGGIWISRNKGVTYVGTDYGLAVSDDLGQNWNHFQLPIPGGIFSDSTQNTVYSVLALPNDIVIALTKSGVFRSDDAVHSWLNIKSGIFASRNRFKLIDNSPLQAYNVFIQENYSRCDFFPLLVFPLLPYSLLITELLVLVLTPVFNLFHSKCYS